MSKPTADSIGPNDTTVIMTVPMMNLPLCARCQHEMAYADTDLAATVELPALMRRQAE
jgi:hypothetical protein